MRRRGGGTVRRTLALATAAICVASASDARAGGRDSVFTAASPAIAGTDFYAFRSYETGRTSFTTLIASYQPGSNRTDAPIHHPWETKGLYEVSIDNDGDAKEDVTFQMRPKATVANGGDGLELPVGAGSNQKNVAVPFAVTGAITASNQASQNLRETYSLKVVRGNRRTRPAEAITDSGTGAATFYMPLDNVGNKTFSNYASYANAQVHDIDIPGCNPSGKAFVGQRQDSGVGVEGAFFDLLSFDLDPATPNPNLVGAQDQGVNVHGANDTVQTMALEVPTNCLTEGGDPEIGAWASASVPATRTLSTEPALTKPGKLSGSPVQVSRLGSPLVNELLIGLPDKQRYNAGAPSRDAALGDYFTHPALPEVVEIQFGSSGVQAPNNIPREDLVDAYLTGIGGVNSTGSRKAEMLRLNTSLPTLPAASQNPLGMLDCFDRTASGAVVDAGNANCDPAGYPNGRRPGDDAYDIAWRVLMGYLAPTGDASSGGLPLVDGAFRSSADYQAAFPYLNTPVGGSP